MAGRDREVRNRPRLRGSGGLKSAAGRGGCRFEPNAYSAGVPIRHAVAARFTKPTPEQPRELRGQAVANPRLSFPRKREPIAAISSRHRGASLPRPAHGGVPRAAQAGRVRVRRRPGGRRRAHCAGLCRSGSLNVPPVQQPSTWDGSPSSRRVGGRDIRLDNSLCPAPSRRRPPLARGLPPNGGIGGQALRRGPLLRLAGAGNPDGHHQA